MEKLQSGLCREEKYFICRKKAELTLVERVNQLENTLTELKTRCQSNEEDLNNLRLDFIEHLKSSSETLTKRSNPDELNRNLTSKREETAVVVNSLVNDAKDVDNEIDTSVDLKSKRNLDELNEFIEGEANYAILPTIHGLPKEKRLVVKEGAKVELKCIAIGNPCPTLIWERPAHSTVSLKQITHKAILSTLTLDSVTSRTHAGVYTCIAENTIGKPVSLSFEVEVQSKPQVFLESDTLYVGQGMSRTIRCVATGLPLPHFWFTKENKNNNNSGKEVVIKPSLEFTVNKTYSAAHLELKKVKVPSDLGIYKCHANNTVGHSTVSVVVKGSPPMDILIKQVEQTPKGEYEVTFTFTTYSVVSEYKIKLRSYNEVVKEEEKVVESLWWELPLKAEGQLKAIGQNKFEEVFRVGNLIAKANMDYDIKVAAKNEFGWSEESPVYRFYTASVCGQNPMATESWKYMVSHLNFGESSVLAHYECLSTITAPPGRRIQIVFLDFESYLYRHCDHRPEDYLLNNLAIYEGQQNTNLLSKYICNVDSAGVTSSNLAHIHLRSIYKYEGHGFKLKFKLV